MGVGILLAVFFGIGAYANFRGGEQVLGGLFTVGFLGIIVVLHLLGDSMMYRGGD